MFFTLVLAFITAYLILITAPYWLTFIFELVNFLLKSFWKGIKAGYYFFYGLILNYKFWFLIFSLGIGVIVTIVIGWGGMLLISTYITYKFLELIKKLIEFIRKTLFKTAII